MTSEMRPTTHQEPRRAFLCHASEDKTLARMIAHSLQAAGIETFFDEWEMRAGDSLRMKLDAGLTDCTHFIALLTPRSIQKPWVQAEMDAAFVRKVKGSCRFIPLRSGLSHEDLPPLLGALISSEIGDNYQADIDRVISEIHEVSRRPPLGQPPESTTAPSGLVPEQTGFSIAAARIANELLRGSKNGMLFDPELSLDTLREATELTDDDIQDGAEELEEKGLVRLHKHIGCGPLGFDGVWPEDELFVLLDALVMDWNPLDDALRIAADLVSGPEDSINLQELAERYHWPARRLNPAVNCLKMHGAARLSEAIGSAPFTAVSMRKISATRRFVRANS